MDPQEDLKRKYNEFVKSREDQLKNLKSVAPTKRTPFNKFYALGIIAGIIIILPALFVFLRSNTYNGENLPTPTNSSITSDELAQELSQMLGADVGMAESNSDLKKTAERNILLKREAQKLGVSTNQIASDETNYALTVLTAEKEVEKRVVTSRTIDFVNVYINPSGNYQVLQKQASENLSFIRTELLAGRSMKEAYANLVNKLGTDPNYAVVENAFVTRESGFIPIYTNALFKAKAGDVTQVINANGTNYMVAKIKTAVNTEFNSLTQWENSKLK